MPRQKVKRLAWLVAWLAKSAFAPGRNAVGEARAGRYREKERSTSYVAL